MVQRIDRRQLLSGLASAALGVPATAASADTYHMNLGRIAADAKVMFGAALGSAYYADPAYAALFEETRLLVGEWQFKMASLRPTRAAYDFYNADRLVALGKSLARPVKAHCLFWQNANPAWMAGMTTADLQRLFDEHIDTVVPRYAGRVLAWDVVNEPFWPADGQPGGFGKGPWYQAFGQDWPLRAFKRISSLDRTAKFALNESQCDNNAAGLGATIRPALLRLVDTLQQAGATLHAVGLESHLDMGQPYDDALFGDFVGQLAQRRIEVWISELDVRDFTLPENIAARDAAIAARVGGFLDHALASPALTQVATWGLSDRYSWLRDVWTRQYGSTTRQPRPLVFDDNMQRKLVWTAMAKSFAARKKG